MSSRGTTATWRGPRIERRRTAAPRRSYRWLAISFIVLLIAANALLISEILNRPGPELG